MNWTEAYLLADMEAEEMMRAEMTDSEMLALIRALLPDTYSESKDWRTGNVTERIICLKAWLESKTEEVDRFIDILNDNRTEAQAAEIESLLGDLAKAQDQIKAQAAEIERLRLLVPRPDQTQDELVWRDHMRGVPLAALAKEFGVTKERMRYRLKKIAETKLHLTGNQP